MDAGNVSSPPRDPADYAAFLTALIARYGPDGTFWTENPQIPKRPQRVWQVWNEPNLDRYWSSPKPFAKPFVALLKAAHQAIKAADPGATVVGPGFGNRSWEAMEQAYRAGMNHSMYDVAATHPFSYRVSNVLKIVKLVRKVMARHGDAKVPLSISEITWASSKGQAATDISDFATTPSGQAHKLTQAYKALMAKRRAWHIQDVIWSTWLTSDGIDGSKNLFDWSGLRKLTRPIPAARRSASRRWPRTRSSRWPPRSKVAPCASGSTPGTWRRGAAWPATCATRWTRWSPASPTIEYVAFVPGRGAVDVPRGSRCAAARCRAGAVRGGRGGRPARAGAPVRRRAGRRLGAGARPGRPGRLGPAGVDRPRPLLGDPSA